jgi:hypothetical protein
MSNRESAPLKPPRRWFQYSLRSFLVLTTALAVWLGIVVNRAREQREAVEAIEALGGRVQYDWEQDLNDPFGEPYGPGGPGWLLRLIGDEYFQTVVAVNVLTADGSKIDESQIRASIPCLQRLPGLRTVYHHPGLSEETKNALTNALPKCSLELGWWR